MLERFLIFSAISFVLALLIFPLIWAFRRSHRLGDADIYERLIARREGRERPGFVAEQLYRLGSFLGNNNGRAAALWLITTVVFFVTISTGSREPILTSVFPPKIETSHSFYPELQRVYDAWQWGEARVQAVEKPAQEMKRGSSFWTWKHWRTFFWLFVFSLIYTPVALREEFREAWSEAEHRIREGREADVKTISTPVLTAAASAGTIKTEGGGISFKRLFRMEIIAEFIGIIFEKLLGALFRRR